MAVWRGGVDRHRHDVFVTAGFYSVVGLDFNINTVAALLLLAGYSIMTRWWFSIVSARTGAVQTHVADRMINLSTNQIATRTTLCRRHRLSVIPLLFGGPVLMNFSIAILFGIVVGTFSSTYVASMLLLYMPAVGRRQC